MKLDPRERPDNLVIIKLQYDNFSIRYIKDFASDPSFTYMFIADYDDDIIYQLSDYEMKVKIKDQVKTHKIQDYRILNYVNYG